ncbi:hypothetical protein Ddc_13464 [Ditylenchus destructor]|nr:hypothetical protein Ddc_13464 [Ditylenchus destructor]
MESLKIRLEALEKQIEENVATHDALLKQQEKSIKALQFKQEKFDAGKAARSVFIPTFKVDEGQRNGITKQNILEFFMQNFHDLNISVQEIRILSRKVGACSALVTLGDLVQCYKVLQRVGPRKRM